MLVSPTVGWNISNLNRPNQVRGHHYWQFFFLIHHINFRMGRERAKRKRDTEDPITREARLKKNREAARDRRASEPLDVRLERLERNREQAR